MDRLMSHLNGIGEIVVKYSTLSEYFDAVNAEAHKKSITFPKYSGDFFPYGTNPSERIAALFEPINTTATTSYPNLTHLSCS